MSILPKLKGISVSPFTFRLGWNYHDLRAIKLEDYERARPVRRSAEQLVLNRDRREEILMEWGHSLPELLRAIRTNLKAKNQRKRTVSNSRRYGWLEEILENTGRSIKNKLLMSRSAATPNRDRKQSSVPVQSLSSQKAPRFGPSLIKTGHGSCCMAPKLSHTRPDHLSTSEEDFSFQSLSELAEALTKRFPFTSKEALDDKLPSRPNRRRDSFSASFDDLTIQSATQTDFVSELIVSSPFFTSRGNASNDHLPECPVRGDSSSHGDDVSVSTADSLSFQMIVARRPVSDQMPVLPRRVDSFSELGNGSSVRFISEKDSDIVIALVGQEDDLMSINSGTTISELRIHSQSERRSRNK